MTYSFHHKTVSQLLLSNGVLGWHWEECGHHCLVSASLYQHRGVILGLLLFGASAQNQMEGFMPVSLSLMYMATVHSRMVKGFLFGVTVPMLALPWLFLFITTLLVPHTVFLCNVMAIIAGGICILTPTSLWFKRNVIRSSAVCHSFISVLSSVVKC